MLILAILTACGGSWEPDWRVPTATINEILGHNATGEVDEAEELEDWIEIHNPSDEAIDLTGWTLHHESDDEAVGPWSFPDGLVLEPGEFLVLWCDGEPEQGELHTGFQIDAGVGYATHALLLFDADEELVEEVRHGILFTDISWARMPDAGEDWRFLHEPTPGASNDAS